LINIKVYNNINTEVDRLIYTAGSIVKSPSLLNYYQVVPDDCRDSRSIILPNVSILRNNTFWDTLKKTEINIPVEASISKKWRGEIINEENEYINNLILNFSDFRIIEKKLFKQITNFIVDINKFIKYPKDFYHNIHIYLTKLGSPASYNFYDDNIYIYYRLDSNFNEIFNILILMTVHRLFFIDKFKNQEHFIQNKYWEIGKYITDFLMECTILKDKYFQNYLSFINKLNKKIPLNHYNKSVKYLEKLGFMLKKSFIIKDNKIYFKDKQVTNLNNHQTIVFKKLIKNEGTIITVDDLLVEIWGSKFTEKYSIYYIPKLISEINSKMKSFCKHKNLIFSKRNQGYMLIQ